jgi:hypothetical protein
MFRLANVRHDSSNLLRNKGSTSPLQQLEGRKW